MNTYEAIDNLIQILGADRDVLKERLLHLEAKTRRKKTVIWLSVSAVLMVLIFRMRVYGLFGAALLPALMLWGCWKEYRKAKKRTAAEALELYLQSGGDPLRSMPLAQVLDQLINDSEASHLERTDGLNRILAAAAALVLGLGSAGSIAMLQTTGGSSDGGHAVYTAAPTATPAPAYMAENGEVTLYNWQDDLENGVLTLPAEVDGMPVRAIGKLAFADRDDITCVIVPEGIVRIDSGAFRSCSSLTRVDLPSTVTEIGAEAFKMCMKLPSCTIPAGVKELRAETFAFCAALETVELPEGLVKISANAFDNCYALASVDLPESLNTISAYAFRNCSKLAEIDIPDTVNSIGAYAFSSCTALEDVTMPASMLGGKISERTFENCSSLVSIRVPDGVLKISERAFYNCAKLSDVYLPSTLRELGSSAFRSCPELRRIEIPGGCEVDERAFKDSPTVVIKKEGR